VARCRHHRDGLKRSVYSNLRSEDNRVGPAGTAESRLEISRRLFLSRCVVQPVDKIDKPIWDWRLAERQGLVEMTQALSELGLDGP
jgi:hypothetical protein